MAFLRLKQEWNSNLGDFNIKFLNFYKCWINIYSGFVTSLWRQTEPNADTQGRDRVQDFKKSWSSKPQNKNLKPNTVQEVGRKTTGRNDALQGAPTSNIVQGPTSWKAAVAQAKQIQRPSRMCGRTDLWWRWSWTRRQHSSHRRSSWWLSWWWHRSRRWRSCRQQRGGSGWIDGLTRAPSGDRQRRGSHKRLGGLSWASRNTDRQRKEGTKEQKMQL